MTDTTATNPVSDSNALSDTGVADQDTGGEKLILEGEVLHDDDQDNGGNADPDATDGEAPAEELEDFEHEGRKLSIPKAIKPLLMMQADYTKKTQELADQRRTLEANATQQAQASEEVLKLRALDIALDTRIAQFANVDWNAMRAQDPTQAASLFMEYQQLREGKSDLSKAITQANEDSSKAQRETRDTQIRERNVVLARDIPGWGQEKAAKLVAFAAAQGVQPEELSEITDHRVFKIINMAMENAAKATQAAKTDRIAAGQRTQPAQTPRGGNGQFTVGADTSDFAAFEKLADSKLKKRA